MRSVTAYFEVGHTVEHAQEGGFVELEEAVLGGFAEEDVGGFESHLVVFAAVDHAGHFFTELLLEDAASGIGTML